MAKGFGAEARALPSTGAITLTLCKMKSLASSVPGNTYTITVTAVGDTFSAYIDGSSTPVTTLTDSIAGSDGIVGLYDDQPNTITGSGFGTRTSFSNFSLTGETVSNVPEPCSLAMLATGLFGLLGFARRK